MSSARLPVTVLYGLPGAGKSTLAARLVEAGSGLRAQVWPVEGHDAALCPIAITAAGAEYLLLEASGACQPERLAARFTRGRNDDALDDLVRLDTMVAVLDAESFLPDFSSWSLVVERGFAAGASDDRAVADALADNIEFADVVVLNKVDRVSALVRRNSAMLIRALNPDAVIVEAEFGDVPRHKLVATHSFDYVRAQGRARWVRVLAGEETSSIDASGTSTFLYEARRPFHPQRLMRFVRSAWPGIIRCRGYFWLATRMDWIGELSQAGPSRRYRPSGSWWATLLAGRDMEKPVAENLAGVAWDARFGDRRQQLAFVGIEMDEAALRQRLDDCLLDDGEWLRGPDAWRTYDDPFPAWGVCAPPHPQNSLH